jgi:hypothetical protein
MGAINRRISMKTMIDIANAIFDVVGASTTPTMYASASPVIQHSAPT